MDVEEYARRIRYAGPLTASPDALHALHVAHVFAVPFENLDIHLGRAISLEPEALYRKLVTERRGGYCFEVNGLFASVLESLGFTVRHLMARVLRGTSAVGPRSHRVILVSLAGRSWIADVGFGGNGLLAPLPLEAGRIERQFAERFRLTRQIDGDYRLECEAQGLWERLYSFALDAHLPVDYTYANYYHSHSPDSLFTQRRLCTKPTPEGRVILQDRMFKVRANGRSLVRSIDTAEAYQEILEREFGLVMAQGDARTCFESAAYTTSGA